MEIMGHAEPQDDRDRAWWPVGSVKVAPRTNRATVLKKAKEEHGDAIRAQIEARQVVAVDVRVIPLDAVSLHAAKVIAPPAPEPELVIE